MPRKDTGSGPSVSAQAQQDAASDGIDAYELPKSLVTKIARSALPDNAKLQKETVLALMKGSTVFINYLAATAHDVASQKQHKSVSASDVLKALELLDMGDMSPKLQQELKAYRDHQKTDKRRGGAKGKAKDAGESASAKVKGKAKAPAAPTITIPGRGAPAQEADAMDGEAEAPGPRGQDEDEDMADADQEEEEIDEEEDVGDEDEDGDEELVDDAALEEEQLRHDARGVEERGGYPEDED